MADVFRNPNAPAQQHGQLYHAQQQQQQQQGTKDDAYAQFMAEMNQMMKE